MLYLQSFWIWITLTFEKKIKSIFLVLFLNIYVYDKFVQDVVVAYAFFLQRYLTSDVFKIYIMLTTSCVLHLE